jgi:type IV secretion system protein VirD4
MSNRPSIKVRLSRSCFNLFPDVTELLNYFISKWGTCFFAVFVVAVAFITDVKAEAKDSLMVQGQAAVPVPMGLSPTAHPLFLMDTLAAGGSLSGDDMAGLSSAFWFLFALLGSPLTVLQVIRVQYSKQLSDPQKIGSFTRFSLGYVKVNWARIALTFVGSFICIMFIGPIIPGPLVSALIILWLIRFQYSNQPNDAKKIDNYWPYALDFLKKHRIRTLSAVIISFICGYFGPISSFFVGPVFTLAIFRIVRSKMSKEKEECRQKCETERRQWFENLGATPAAREKAINEMFDRKDKTLRYATLDEGLGTGQIIYYIISRNLASMETREREFLRAVELIHSVSDTREKEEGWYNWAKGGLIWGDGKANINEHWYNLWEKHGETVTTLFKDAPSAIKWHMDKQLASVDKVVNNVLQRLEKLASQNGQRPELAALLKSINKRLKGGSEWLSSDDISKTLFAKQNDYTLRIGLLDDTGNQLTYSGEGSLISIAPPGSGKTQCNVFPNLLTWRGPAVILDVKGEIYAGTSKWRQANVGPVYKFSPLDPAKSHCYNPLSFIRMETDYIWEDSRFLADMMIVPSGGTDPFWENKARDVLTAAIAHVCYSNGPDKRPMSLVTDIIYGGKAWQEMVLGLQTAVDVRSMMQQGTSLAEMNEKTRDSVLQTAQSSLSAWTGERISRVTQKSDWSPLDLRNGKNPTIYICLKPNEVDSYISLLRVFIAQHIRILTSELPPHGVAPILFLLDELPRLKHMPPVEEAIEIGRQYGLRLWMFAQSLGQLKESYKNAEGIVGSCAVRIFMNPSSHDGTAEKLSEELGFRQSALDGSRLKVVEAAELAGPDYRDYQIVMAASCKPVKVKKAFAWQDAELSSCMGSL